MTRAASLLRSPPRPTASIARLGRRAAPLLAALLAGAAPAAAAQEVRGRILGGDGAPLAGAYVVLMDPTGEAVARTISTSGGAFSMRAPAPGPFTLRAEHIGFATVEAPVTAEAGRASVLELTAEVRAIELEELVAEVERECRVDDGVGVRLAELWDEVGKAFRATALVEERGTYLMEVDRWRRRLEPRYLRVEEEERSPRRGFHRGSPFTSPEPERLAREGYIRGDPSEGHDYFGPDARVLTSRSFQDTHCFGFTDEPPEDGEPGWVGIRFRPRDHDAFDIEGTLWIHEATFEPRRLDFRFSRLPYAVETRIPGGRVEFTRLPEGPWIVHRWRIRVPLVGRRNVRIAPGGTARPRYELVAVMENGGEVLRVRPAGERRTLVLGSLGRLEGTVRETTGEPVPGASVRVAGTSLRTRADERGRFALSGVPEGRYTVTWTSPALDSLALPGASRDVDVRPGESFLLDAVLPPAGVAMAESCTEPLHPEGTGVLRGRVAAPEGTLPERTVVRVRWEVVEGLSTVRSMPRRAERGARRPGSGLVVQGNALTATVPVEAGGAWMACGVPEDETLRVWAETAAGARPGQAIRVRLRTGEIRVLRPALAAAEPGPAARRDTVEADPGRSTRATGRLVEDPGAPAPISVEVPRTVEEVRRRAGSSAPAVLAPLDVEVAPQEGARTVGEPQAWVLPGELRIGPFPSAPNRARSERAEEARLAGSFQLGDVASFEYPSP